MLKRITKLVLILFFVVFIFQVTSHYFSEENIIFTNKSRSTYMLESAQDNNDLPLLKNDTSNIIVYKDDIEEFKKKTKKRFWEKLITNSNE